MPLEKTISDLRLEYSLAPWNGRLPIEVVAAGLGVPVSALRAWHRRKAGPPRVRVSQNRHVYMKEDVEAWIASLREGGAA